MTVMGPAEEPLRVVLVDDSSLFRAGLAGLLTAAGMVVVDQLPDTGRLPAVLAHEGPDVVVLDVRLPPTFTDEGISAAVDVRSQTPRTGVLVLSTYAEGSWATRLFARGSTGLGYLLKDRVDDVSALVEALRRLARGGTVVDPEVVSLLVASTRRTTLLDDLSERERTVLELMAEGLSNVGIGRRLFLSPRTVETHIAAVFHKLPLDGDDNTVNRRVLAVLRFLQEQALPPGSAG